MKKFLSPGFWIGLCFILQRCIRFLASAVLVALAINIGSTWLTSPDDITRDTPLGWMKNHLFLVSLVIIIFFLCMLFIEIVCHRSLSRQSYTSTTHLPMLLQRNHRSRPLIALTVSAIGITALLMLNSIIPFLVSLNTEQTGITSTTPGEQRTIIPSSTPTLQSPVHMPQSLTSQPRTVTVQRPLTCITASYETCTNFEVTILSFAINDQTGNTSMIFQITSHIDAGNTWFLFLNLENPSGTTFGGQGQMGSGSLYSVSIARGGTPIVSTTFHNFIPEPGIICTLNASWLSCKNCLSFSSFQDEQFTF